MAKCIFNGSVIDEDKASVKLNDLALLRGYGVFDFFRLEGSVPLFIDDHLDRFYQSAAGLRLSLSIATSDLKLMIFEMLTANKIHNSGVRLVLTGGASPNGYSIGPPTLFVRNEPLPKVPDDHFRHGIKLISLEYQRSIPKIKSINYLMGIYMTPEVEAAGAQDILYHSKGQILELTRSNFFIVDNSGKVITADKNILLGINRKNLIKWASADFIVEERSVSLEELNYAKEAFITGTTKKVMPVAKIDDLAIGNGVPGPITRQLQELYQKNVEIYLMNHPKIF